MTVMPPINSKPHWKLLPPIAASMSFHMALDEVLFREMEENPQAPVLRFYYADKPTVTVGYSHREKVPGTEAPLNGTRYRSTTGLPIVQRMTGGGRVIHGNDLVFSLVARKEHDVSFRSVRVSYWKIHEALKKGFEILGLDARFYRCDEDLPEGPDCFRFPISTDLALGKNKIAGGSQKRSAGALLHQESVADCGVEGDRLAAAFVQGFEAVFGVKMENGLIDPAWFEMAKPLEMGKYQVVNSHQSQDT